LGANPESYEMFVVLEIVQAEVLGRITRIGFVEGWARVMDESQGKVTADWASQKRLVRSRINTVANDPAYFKTLYDFAFQIGKEPPQKALDMDFALMFWSALFAPTMNSWQSANVDWLDAWKQYLTEKFYVERVGRDGQKTLGWTRTVTKDLWNQTRCGTRHGCLPPRPWRTRR
jgi:DCN1-like protein 1/2